MIRIAMLCAVPLLLASACGDSGSAPAAGGAGGGAGGALPEVAGASNAKPTIKIPSTPAPKELVKSVITEGKGPEVKSGQQITVQYVGQIWNTGKQFDASWDRGQPATFGIGVRQVIQGWDEGLVGQKIGSRVLLVIPPEKGYGSAGRPPSILGTDTMVFVVDILDSK